MKTANAHSSAFRRAAAAYCVLLLGSFLLGGGHLCAPRAADSALSVWTVDPLVKVFRDAQPGPAIAPAEVARGDCASIQVVVRSDVPIRKLSARVSPLTREGSPETLASRSARIEDRRAAANPLTREGGSQALTLGRRVRLRRDGGSQTLTPRPARFVGYVPVDRPTQRPSKDQLRPPPADYPDPLLESASVEVGAGQAQPIWLSIPVPTNAVPGTYRGIVALAADVGGQQVSLDHPITVVVYPAVAGPARLWVTEWYALHWPHMQIAPAPESDEYYALLHRYARNMAEHRHNVALISPLSLARFTVGANRGLEIDFTRFDRWVQIFQEAGVIGRIEGGHIGGRKAGWESDFVVTIHRVQDNRVVTEQVDPTTPEAEAFYAQFFPALVAHLKAKNWLGIYMQHLADEPIPPNVASYRAMAALARKHGPELKIIEACHTKDLVGAIDIWVPQLNFLHDDFAHYQARQKAGDEVWFYTCVFPQGEYANRFLEQPLIKTRLLHWINYRHGVTGYLHWGYNQWTADSPFTHTTRPHGGPPYLPAGDPWIVYPGTNGPLDSIRFEAMRDGIADVALLQALGDADAPSAQAIAKKLILGFDQYQTDVSVFRSVRRELLTLVSTNQLAAWMNEGHRLVSGQKFAAARQCYLRVADAAQAAPVWKTLALLRVAETYAAEKDYARATVAFDQVRCASDSPAHLKAEAAERLVELDRVQRGLAPHDLALSRRHLPPWPKPGRTYYVAPDGSDANPGSQAKPWSTLERARDEIRSLKQNGGLPEGGVQVLIQEGDYAVKRTLQLTQEDSGTAYSPIVFRAANEREPCFRGGVRLCNFTPVKDPTVLSTLPEETRDKVWQTDLKAQGITELIPLRLGGFSSGSGFTTHPAIELFEDGAALQLARWPNDGFLHVGEVLGQEPISFWGTIKGTKEGVFTYTGERPARWTREKDAWLYGYWFWDWADSYEKIQSIDPAKHVITLAKPYHTYGYRKDQRYYALNLLCELDQPGEWYLDRNQGVLYCYPHTDPNQSVMELSLLPVPMVELKQVSHVRFANLGWELGSADAIHVEGGEDVLFLGCTIRRFAGDGVVIHDGNRHGLLACDIYSMGRGATLIDGGDRKTLRPGGNFLENCHIHDLSRIDHTYTPAVVLNGVGNRVAHNRMHDIRSSAMRIEGNDHLIEYNEVHDVVWESDDQGGADMFGNPTYRGNVYRYNYWHHIGNWKNPGASPALGRAGIRLDDAICGVLIYGNVFYRASAGAHGFGGVQIHGGKDNILDNNVFIDCAAAISCSPWGDQRWRDYVKKALEADAIDATLYRQRYPELQNLAAAHDVNAISRNFSYNCGEFLRHDSKRNTVLDNQITTGAEIRPPALPNWPGLRPIPFAEIGLYRDQYRRSLPSQ